MSAPALTVQRQGQSSVSADNLNTFLQTCDTVAQLRAFVGIQGVQVYVRGVFTPNDGGAGNFMWDATGTAPDDGTNIIVPPAAGAGEWVRISTFQPYDIAVYFSGVPASAQVFRYTATRTLIFPADFQAIFFGQSVASADVAATASAVFPIDKAFAAAPNTFNNIGYITFAAAADTATFTSTFGVSYALAVGDVLRIVAPIVPDATLAGVSITLAGERLG